MKNDRWRKRPVVVRAWQFWGDPEKEAPMPRWLSTPSARGLLSFGSTMVLIGTREGTMRADAGDWIVKGVKGELYPCKPDIFAATYEAVI